MRLLKIFAVFLFASSLAAQVQIGKGVQIGGTGSGGYVSGQANGVIPLATGSTAIGAQSHINENTSGVTTFTQNIADANASATQSIATFNATTASSAPAFTVFSPSMTVTSPGVFGYSGESPVCIIAVVGGVCYADSPQAIDAINNAGYTHTVALAPSVVQSPLRTFSSSDGSDVYGVPVGITVGPGIWPGSGFRVEGPVGVDSAHGQVAVGYDTVYGITPTLIYGRPNCRTDTCNSMDIRLQGVNAGTLQGVADLFEDYLGNLQFILPNAFIVDSPTAATSSTNVDSPWLLLTANGWDGSSSSSVPWSIFNNINGSGTVYISQLVVNGPAGIPSSIILNADTTVPNLTISAISGSTQCLHVNTAGQVSGTGSDCAGGGGTAWSALTNPTGNLALTMGSYSTAFTWGAATGSGDLFSLTDTASNTGTGILFHPHTQSGSTEDPFQADVNGCGFNAAGGTLNVFCSTEPTQTVMTYNAGHAPAGAAGAVVFAPDTTGNFTVNPNNIGFDVLAPLASGFVSGHCGQPTSSGGVWTIADSGAACGGSGSFTALTGDATSTSTGGATTVVGINGTLLSGLSTGLAKITTGTGAVTTVAAPTGAVVGTTDTQTLTGKTVDGVTPATMAFVDPTSSIQTQLNGKQASLSLVAGTYVNGELCTYASSGTLLNCNTAVPTGTVTDGSGSTTASQLAVATSTAHVQGYVTTLPTAAEPAHTGDVTNTAGSLALTIAANAVTGAKMANSTVTATQLAAQYSKGSCTEVWVGSGTSSALTSGDDAVSNNTCYNDSGVTRTITAVKCRSDNGSNTTTTNPTFGSAGTGTTILSGAVMCGSSYAYSSSGTVSNASWTTGTGIDPAMAGSLTGTSIAMIVEYTY